MASSGERTVAIEQWEARSKPLAIADWWIDPWEKETAVINFSLFGVTLQVDEIEALQSKCKLGVKNHSNRLKEISSQLKAAIADETSATKQVIVLDTYVKWLQKG